MRHTRRGSPPPRDGATPVPTRERLRGLLRLVAWCSLLAGAHVAVLVAGQVLPTPPGPGPALVTWLGRADPFLTAFALLRLVALAICWYLTGLTALAVLARASGLPGLLRVVEQVTLPALRGVLRHAVGAGLTITIAGGTLPLFAGATLTGVAAADPAPPAVTMQVIDEGPAADAPPVRVILLEDDPSRPPAPGPSADAPSGPPPDTRSEPGAAPPSAAPSASPTEPRTDPPADPPTDPPTDLPADPPIMRVDRAPVEATGTGAGPTAPTPGPPPGAASEPPAGGDQRDATTGPRAGEGPTPTPAPGDGGSTAAPASPGSPASPSSTGPTGAPDPDPAAPTPPAPGPSAGAPDPEPASPPAPATWTVQPGDHLWHIAAATVQQAAGPDARTGDAAVAAYWRTLIDANRDRLVVPGNPDLILPGQQFVLPPVRS